MCVVALPASEAAASVRTVCPAGPPSCQFATIQDAISAADAGDRIVVSAGTYEGDVTITHDVRLIGAGDGRTTISGGVHSATVAASANVLIKGIGLTGATSAHIVNDGSLTLRRSRIDSHDSMALGEEVAGILNNGTLALYGTTMSAGYAEVGGILNNGTATVVGSVLSGNRANGAGAIKNLGSMTIRATTISDNQVVFSSGGIHNFGSLVIRKSRFSHNNGQGSGMLLKEAASPTTATRRCAAASPTTPPASAAASQTPARSAWPALP